MIDSRAQYKVYEPIRTSVRLHAGGWHTHAGHRFFPSVVAEHALLTARADRAAGRCTILCWYRIDHSTSLAQRRSAREESEPDPAWPSVASPVEAEFAVLETHVPLDAQRLLRFACGLHHDMRVTRVHVVVKTAMEKEQTRERERYTRTIASRRVPGERRKVPTAPLSPKTPARCTRRTLPLTPLLCVSRISGHAVVGCGLACSRLCYVMLLAQGV